MSAPAVVAATLSVFLGGVPAAQIQGFTEPRGCKPIPLPRMYDGHMQRVTVRATCQDVPLPPRRK